MFDDAIVIFIFLFNDKIVFIRMHDDKQTYSIYMIVDNLNVETKRNQTRFETIQFLIEHQIFVNNFVYRFVRM